MFEIFTRLADLVSYGLLMLEKGTGLATAVHFFIDDVTKILALMMLIIFLTGFFRSALFAGAHSGNCRRPVTAFSNIVILICGLLLFHTPAKADSRFVREPAGDHYFYYPATAAKDVLVIAHGTRIEGTTPEDTARRYIERWTGFADANDLVLITPVFDNDRFGNTGGGYGGYRGLFGKVVGADQFVIDLVTRHRSALKMEPKPVFLYGHSAGAQFVLRFLVRHPEFVASAVVTAPGRFPYPTKAAKWPYGAGKLARDISWRDGTVQSVRVAGDLEKFARAAGKAFVIVGARDVKTQPVRPGHTGSNRVEFAKSWVAAMNRNARLYRQSGGAGFSVIPGIGHDSARLTSFAQGTIRGRLADRRTIDD